MFRGFKDFITRGNVIDLAVAVVIGAAFTAVVNSIVENVFNPLIGAVFNAKSLAKSFPLIIPTTSGGNATIYFGAVVAALINFLIVAIIVYFVFVVPINAFNKRTAALLSRGVVEDKPQGPTDIDLLTEIRDLLARTGGTGIETATPTGTTADIAPDGPGRGA